MIAGKPDCQRIVITGVGLAAPNGNNLPEFRESLLNGRSGVRPYDIRYVGSTLAGVCSFDELKYQYRKDLRRGTRAGSMGVYCASEAIADAGLDWPNVDKSMVGIYVGVTEHGNVETENEIYAASGLQLRHELLVASSQPADRRQQSGRRDFAEPRDHRPALHDRRRLRRGQRGDDPGAQMLLLDECDVALAGGVSESIHTFGIFASFKSQGALASHADPTKASRPFDADRNGIVVAEGGGMFVLERMSDAKARRARIYGELAGYAMNSDASDFVLPNPQRQAECIQIALNRAGITADTIDIVSTHATGTTNGDTQECEALRRVFGGSSRHAVQQHQELHRPRDGCRRSARTGRQLAGLRRRLLPPDDQSRSTGSGLPVGRDRGR